MEDQIFEWIQSKKLVAVTYVRQKVGPTTIFGRIISINQANQDLLIYDDDQKKVVHLNMNEIDDMKPAIQ